MAIINHTEIRGNAIFNNIISILIKNEIKVVVLTLSLDTFMLTQSTF